MRARASLCAVEGTLWPISGSRQRGPIWRRRHLKGKVEAARFVEGEEAVGGVGPGCRCGPALRMIAAQDSELLFGEIFTVYERKDGWAWGQAETDSYVGYVRESGAGPSLSRPTRM